MAGRELFEKIGKPRKIVAPMVDHLELAWRILLRRYGAELCYTPMFHARLFATVDKYREKNWGPWDGIPEKDRPLIVQFCANEPEYLLQAAKLVEDKCDGVDLNLGCPQGIAKKGHYGAFLMDDWDLVYRLINKLHTNLKVAVTAKIRVYEDWQKSLDYAKMVLSAGAQFITIHGRTREMKGQRTGLADWKLLAWLREQLGPDQVFFTNGNVLYPEDVGRSLAEIRADAVMSAEGNLYNPGVFWTESNDIDRQFPRVDKLLREYYNIVKETPGEASRVSMKSHMFKMMVEFLNVHRDLRPKIGKLSVRGPLHEWEPIVEEVEQIVAEIYAGNPDDKVENGPLEPWGGCYKKVPYWRCQPYFRKVNGLTLAERAETETENGKIEATPAKREAETPEETPEAAKRAKCT